MGHDVMECADAADRLRPCTDWRCECKCHCDHESTSGLGDDLWRCDACGVVQRQVDDPNGNVHLTELIDGKRIDKRVRYEDVPTPSEAHRAP